MNIDKVFENIGYKKTYDEEWSVVYTKEIDEEERYEIEFFKMLDPHNVKCTCFFVNAMDEEVEMPYELTVPEVNAIYLKCKELRWYQ